MDYLNQEHPVFRDSKAKHADAVRELLDRALRCSHSFRLEFDLQRLEGVIGAETLLRLMPGLPTPGAASRVTSHVYDVYEDHIDVEKAEILRRILSSTPEGYSESPLTYVESIRLLDEDCRTVLRGSDMLSFILFSLPGADRAALIKAYAQNGIPETVIEEADVDVEKLKP
jgi:hypothetical protein